jgi:aminopeptidase N
VAIVRTWAADKSGHGTTEEFIALAEDVAGRQLDEVFSAWLFTAGRPDFSEPAGQARVARSPTRQARERAARWVYEVQGRLVNGRY